ncbi:MAG: tetratricopeptide repeat protein [Nitrospinae bacterium]|nr:tetratricopeptide repeat protein [Nitrospinota bacterium]
MKTKAISLLIILFMIGLGVDGFAQSADEAVKLYKQGMEAYQYGRYQESLNYFERSLKISRSLNHLKGISANLNNIGDVYNSLGQYQEALKYYEESLKIFRELKVPQNIAISLNNIGSVYSSLGQYEKVLSYFEESLKIFRELKVPQNIAISLNNIGSVYSSLGQYKKALSYHEESLNIRRQLNIPQDIALSLNNIGSVYDSLGQYEKALKYYEESLKTKRENNLSPQDIATSLNNIGVVYNALGQYEKALSYYDESLRIRKELKIPQDIAESLNNIGVVYKSIGQYEKALRYYEESLKIDRELNIPQNIATSLSHMGSVYLFLKDYEKAEGLFKEAEKEIARTGYEWRGNPSLVELYIATGRHYEALKLIKEATPEWNEVDSYRIQFYTQHGFALKGSERFNEASYEFLKAVSITEDMRQRVKGERGGFLGGGLAGGRIRAYRGLFSTLAERAINPPSPPFNKGGNLESPPLAKGDIGGFSIDKEFTPYGKDLSSAWLSLQKRARGLSSQRK